MLASESPPPGLGVGAPPCALAKGEQARVLNLSFVFLLAKFIASWRAGGLFKGGKKGHLRHEDKKKSFSHPRRGRL